MRKTLLLTACAVLAFSLFCSKRKAPDDADKLASDTYTLNEFTADRLAKSQTAQEASDALVVFAVEKNKISLRKKQFIKKNPDYLKRTGETGMGRDKRNEASSKALSAAVSQSVMKFAGSKELSDAIMRLSELTEEKE
jgi:hypothetical protein